MSKNSEGVKNWRRNTKNKLVLAMGSCCQICGYDKCIDALEFHHLNPDEKDFKLGSIRASPKNIMAIVEELKKCVLLCSNCHREFHAGLVSIPENHAILNESIAFSKRKKCKFCKTQYMDILNTSFCSLSCQGKYNISKKTIDEVIQQSKEKYNKLIESGINLSEYGWVMKSSRYLGISHTQVKRLINKYHSGPVYRNGTIIELMPPSSNG